jgi:FdhD protein
VTPDDPTVAIRRIVRVARGTAAESRDDAVATERALEIRIDGQSLAVTLRTPGHDRELATGFLFTEGIVRRAADVAGVAERAAACDDEPDTIDITLTASTPVDWTRLERRFAATSACGLCGRAHLESLRAGLAPVDAAFRVGPEALLAAVARMPAAQPGFARTGGLHAAALLDATLAPVVLREDVGRHNAVDKVVGARLDAGAVPVTAGVLWVSGRAGAEIVLKAARAGIPVLASVGAPSSLAVDLATAARMTLAGFVRDGRMNVYAGAERLGLA